MSAAVAALYDEAALVKQDSPRSAAALLRLCLEGTLKEQEIGEARDSLSERIGVALGEGTLDANVAKAADLLRLSGNDAVHEAGTISELDTQEDVEVLFKFVNHVVHKLITEQQEVDELLNRRTTDERQHIEERNARHEAKESGDQ